MITVTFNAHFSFLAVAKVVEKDGLPEAAVADEAEVGQGSLR